MSPLQLNLTSAVIPVELNTGNAILKLEIREMTAALRDKYLDTMSDRCRLDAKGAPCGIKKFEGMNAELLVLCLFKEDGKPVTKEEIQKWPGSVVTSLFEAAQRINHLLKEEKEAEPKND